MPFIPLHFAGPPEQSVGGAQHTVAGGAAEPDRGQPGVQCQFRWGYEHVGVAAIRSADGAVERRADYPGAAQQGDCTLVEPERMLHWVVDVQQDPSGCAAVIPVQHLGAQRRQQHEQLLWLLCGEWVGEGEWGIWSVFYECWQALVKH